MEYINELIKEYKKTKKEIEKDIATYNDNMVETEKCELYLIENFIKELNQIKKILRGNKWDS